MRDSFRFFPNMQIVADGLAKTHPELKLYPGEDACGLEGVAAYLGQTTPVSYYVYIAGKGALDNEAPPETHCSIISVGCVPDSWNNGVNSVIELPGDVDAAKLLNECQDILRKTLSWADSLKDIALRGGSIDDLCRASLGYFGNPILVNDARYNLISCPDWREGMMRFQRDEKTGISYADIEDVAYLKQLPKFVESYDQKGAHIFSATPDKHRQLYVNIRNEYDRFEGCLIVEEIDNPLTPGQSAAAEYLGSLIEELLAMRKSTEMTCRTALDKLLYDLIKGKTYPDEVISKLISPMKWNISDTYVCACCDAGRWEVNPGSAVAVCNHIEKEIDGSSAFCMTEGEICIVVNTTLNPGYRDIEYDDVAYNTGAGNIFRDLRRIGTYYRQAEIALKHCQNESTLYRCRFSDIAMDYVAGLSTSSFKSEELCASELMMLMEYDEKRKTELYKTLRMYVLSDRNTVAASEALFIGRSTLFYRLKKIREITGLTMEKMAEPGFNLYLRFSIFLMDRQEKKGR